jgi:hypothetical protein
MKKILIITIFIIILSTFGCSTPCSNSKDEVTIKIHLIDKRVIEKKITIPSRSKIKLSQNMILYYTRGCSDEFKIAHDKDCAGKFTGREHFNYGSELTVPTGYRTIHSKTDIGTRIAVGVVSCEIIKRR